MPHLLLWLPIGLRFASLRQSLALASGIMVAAVPIIIVAVVGKGK
jgi:hypothetical protein